MQSSGSSVPTKSLDVSGLSEDRFWSKVSPEPNTGCWLWTASVDRRGYGQFSLGGKPARAHRVAWVLSGRGRANGRLLMHACDNALCVNPDHLSEGVYLDNSRDMDAKGRRVNSPKRGTDHSINVLSESEVRVVRTLRGSATAKEVASMFGVHRATVYAIWSRRIWGWLC